MDEIYHCIIVVYKNHKKLKNNIKRILLGTLLCNYFYYAVHYAHALSVGYSISKQLNNSTPFKLITNVFYRSLLLNKSFAHVYVKYSRSTNL